MKSHVFSLILKTNLKNACQLNERCFKAVEFIYSEHDGFEVKKFDRDFALRENQKQENPNWIKTGPNSLGELCQNGQLI